METSTVKPATSKPSLRKWIKRFGIWGFLFFLLKGLMWVGVAVWGWWMAS